MSTIRYEIKCKLVFTNNTTDDKLRVIGYVKVCIVFKQKWEDLFYNNVVIGSDVEYLD